MTHPARTPDPRQDTCARYGLLGRPQPDLDRLCAVLAAALDLSHVAVVCTTARRSWVAAATGWTTGKLPGATGAWTVAAPLTTPDGLEIGQLLAAGTGPAAWTPARQQRLEAGAALVTQLLEARAATRDLQAERRERAALERRLSRATLTARTFQAIADLTDLPLDEDGGLRGAARLTAELIGVHWCGVQTGQREPDTVWPPGAPLPGPLPRTGPDALTLRDAADGWTLPGGRPAALAVVASPDRAARLLFVRRGRAARWTGADRQVLGDLAWALRHLLSFAAQRSALAGLEGQLDFALRSFPMILWVTDAAGVVRAVEGSGLSQLNVTPAQVLGRPLADLLPDLRGHAPGGHPAGQEQRCSVTLAGRVYDVHQVTLPRGGTLGVAFDVTDLAQSRSEARRAQQHAETLLELTQVMALSGTLGDVTAQALEVLLPALPHTWLVLWTHDPQDRHLRPLVARGEQPVAAAQWQSRGLPDSDAYARLLLRDETVQLDPQDLPGSVHDAGIRAALLLPVVAGDSRLVLGAYRRDPLPWTPFERELLSVASRVLQVSLERRETLASLRSAATTDPLTGLRNRRAFEEDLRAALRRGPLTLVTLDVDGLKRVNDTQGHARGDELLRAVTRAAQAVLGSGDRAYRVGGDEFCLLIAGTPGQVIAGLERALTEHVAAFPEAGASAGLACAPADGEHPELLWQIADERMYSEKARRRRARFQP